MMHSAWLQNRSGTRALDGKTPYEMTNKRKPHLADIQEFGVAAYVKDLKARKLDSRAQVGRFVGYYLESEGYRIYWLNKRSVSVKRNVVFNPDDILTTNDEVVIPGDVLAEGERDKVIQPPEANSELEKGKNTDPDTTPADAPPNSIPFPPANQTESHDSPDEPSTG